MSALAQEAPEPPRTSLSNEPAEKAASGAAAKDARPSLQLTSSASRKEDILEHQTASGIILLQEEGLDDDRDHFGSRFVMLEMNPFRMFWSGVVCVLLVYTASVFLYRFCFCSFHIGPNGLDPLGEDDLGWTIVEWVVDVLFWVDLVLTFFIAFKDDRGREVDSLRVIARAYLRFFFWVNLLACLPPEAFSGIVTAAQPESQDGSGVDLRVARVYRLQRISRLMRLARITRLLKLVQIMKGSHLWKRFQALRGVRVINFIVGLFWSLHILACGWYLCAALHADVQQTWVARRSVNADSLSLLEVSPFEQWLVSMYFVLTVFTTVGFGDISAGTEAEIIYVAVTMLIGAVVHSIIISEVIGIVTSTDEVQKAIDKQIALIDAFEAHSELDTRVANEMKAEITWRAKAWAISYGWSKAEMKELLTGKFMPRWLIAKVPNSLFGGALLRNQYLRVLDYVPPRLPCLLAVHMLHCDFEADETVFQMGDYPFNVFLVLSGTYAHVGRPGPQGGTDSTGQGEQQTCGDSNVRAPASCKRSGSGSNQDFGGADATPRSAVYMPSATFSSLTALQPYRLFSHGTYFGEAELITGKPRAATTRCERRGATLTLHKNDFAEIDKMFPHFGVAWAHRARRRERFRELALGKLVQGLHYKLLAVTTIQSFYRRVKQRTEPAQTVEDAGQGVSMQEVAAVSLHRHATGKRRSSVTQIHGHEKVDKDVHASVAALRHDFDDFRKEMRAFMQEQRSLRLLQGKDSTYKMPI